MEAGMSIALLMELSERGIVTEEDMRDWAGEPLSLRWGNWDTVDKLIDAIALPRRIG